MVAVIYTTLVSKEGKLYVAWCPELNISSKGKTPEKAIENLEDEVAIRLERVPASASTA